MLVRASVPRWHFGTLSPRAGDAKGAAILQNMQFGSTTRCVWGAEGREGHAGKLCARSRASSSFFCALAAHFTARRLQEAIEKSAGGFPTGVAQRVAREGAQVFIPINEEVCSPGSHAVAHQVLAAAAGAVKLLGLVRRVCGTQVGRAVSARVGSTVGVCEEHGKARARRRALICGEE